MGGVQGWGGGVRVGGKGEGIGGGGDVGSGGGQCVDGDGVGGGVYSAWGLKTLLDLYGFIKNKTWKKLPLFLQMLSVFPSPKLHALESQ